MTVVPRHRSLARRLLAGSAVAALALGGTLLSATAASAAPGDDLVILTPTSGSTQTSTSFTVTGTASDGATVTVVDEQPQPFLVGTATVGSDGTFTVGVYLVNPVTTPQTLTFTQIADGDSPRPNITEATLVVNLDLTPAPTQFVVTSPSDGDSIPSRNIRFAGTAPAGSTVAAAVDGRSGDAVVADAAGNFAFDSYVPFEYGTEVTAVLTTTLASPFTPPVVLPAETLELTLLAPLPSPVILTPKTGSTITGGTVTVNGTGTAGAGVSVIIGPADDATATAIGYAGYAYLANGIVSPDGSFSVSTTIPLGNFTAFALLAEAPVDEVDSEILSLRSNQVAFSLVAAAAPAAVLAATGPTSTRFAGPAAALLLAGLLMLVASRRRRSLV